MKLLLAGSSWQHEMYEAACAAALERLGVDVIRFDLGSKNRSLLSRFEYKYTIRGPNLRRLQNSLLEAIKESRPDVVLIWLGASVFPETLKAIKRIGRIKLVSYVHDDPFAHRIHELSPRHHAMHWRAFIECLPYYDLSLFSKQKNVEEARIYGAPNAEVLRQYYVRGLHRPIELTSEDAARYNCDAVLAGHYEPDGRGEYIRALADAGLRVHVYGDFTWKEVSRSFSSPNLKILPRVSGEEYVKALTGAKMCLCFLSKMNRDQYTTRCFEIPACGRLLLSERTPDLQNMYLEDREAVFFTSVDELLVKALWLKDDPEAVSRISAAGMLRVHADRHSIDERMEDFLDMMNKLFPSVDAAETTV